MSRQLPAHPHLDHLRSQAKELLATARAQFPDWQLADAQFALARDYGFSSWPAMRAHIDALAHSTSTTPPREQPVSVAADPEGAPLEGTWIANVSDSDRHPAMTFRSATLTVTVRGAIVTMTQVVVSDDGAPSGSSLTFETDCRPHQPSGMGQQHWLTARWVDARTLEVVDTVDGQEHGRGIYQVSPDDRRLTVNAATHRLVFDRA